MRVFVKMLTGRTGSIEVEPSRDTVDRLKDKIEESMGLPFENQQLIFSGRQLADGHKLSKYNLVESCTLFLIPDFPVRLAVAAPRYIYVQTRTLVSKTIVLQVDPSDTICNVRKKIGRYQNLFLAHDPYARGKFGRHHQILYTADGSKKPLSDARTFGYFFHEIPDGSTLNLDFSVMQIFVKMRNGKTITLEMDPSDKIGDVKAKIRDQQRIIFDGHELSDQQRHLGCYDIHHESTVHLELCRPPQGESMRISVKTLASIGTEGMIKFKVLVSDKIGDVKAKIQDQQRLLFNGRQLADRLTLADYGIKNKSTLHLQYRPMQVSVKMFDGQTIPLEVKLSNTIGDVKKMVGEHQSLTFDGNELDDGKTLAEYNVIMGSTLHLD